MKNKKGKLKWIIVFLILISVTIIPATSYTAETKEPITLSKGFKEKIGNFTPNLFDKPATIPFEPVEKKEETAIHFEPIEKEKETTLHLEPIEPTLDWSAVKKPIRLSDIPEVSPANKYIIWRIIAVIIIAIFILCIVIALIRVYKKRYKINSKEKGFLRLTLVLSILAYGIAFICYHNAHYDLTRDNAPYLAFGYFIAIWIAYAIIPPIVKWIIRGFKKEN